MELISTGEFHLDPVRAREKLREYQLPSPDHYILELVKAAHLLGAGEFHVTLDAGHTVVGFDGEFLSVEELSRLYSAAFSERRNPRNLALRHLAMAVHALEGGGASSVAITAGGATPVTVVLSGGEIKVLETAHSTYMSTSIEIQKNLGRRISRFFTRIASFGEHPEVLLLKQHTEHSRVDIHVDRRKISEGFELRGDGEDSGFDVTRSFEVPVTMPGAPDEVFVERGLLGLARREMGTVGTRIQVVQHGVLLSDTLSSPDFDGFRVHALVDSPVLNTNISQSAFVEDSAWRKMKYRLSGQMLLAVRDFLRDLVERGESLRTGGIHALLQKSLDMSRGEDIPEEAREALIECIRELPVLTALDRETRGPGEPISPGEAVVDGERIYYIVEGERLINDLPEDVPIVCWQWGGERVARDFLRNFAGVMVGLSRGAQSNRITLEPWRPEGSGQADEFEEVEEGWMFGSLPDDELESYGDIDEEADENRSPRGASTSDVAARLRGALFRAIEEPREAREAVTPEEDKRVEAEIAEAATTLRSTPVRWIDGDGTTLIRMEAGGFAADRNHEVIRVARERPDVPILRAFGAAALRSQHLALEGGQREVRPDPVVSAYEKRRFLKSMSSRLEREVPWH